MHHQPRQTGFRAPEYVPLMLSSETILAYMETLRDQIEKRPDLCIVPYRKRFYFRFEGQRVAASTRSLYFHHIGRTLPRNGFAAPTCGNAGCVNPLHQASREPGAVSAIPAVRLRPRNVVQA